MIDKSLQLQPSTRLILCSVYFYETDAAAGCCTHTNTVARLQQTFAPCLGSITAEEIPAERNKATLFEDKINTQRSHSAATYTRKETEASSLVGCGCCQSTLK